MPRTFQVARTNHRKAATLFFSAFVRSNFSADSGRVIQVKDIVQISLSFESVWISVAPSDSFKAFVAVSPSYLRRRARGQRPATASAAHQRKR